MIRITQTRRGPRKAAGHILHHNSDRDDQTRDEAPARLIVTAQKDVKPDKQHKRHDHPRQHNHHHRVHGPGTRLIWLAVQQAGAHRAVKQCLCEGVDQQCGNAEHDDFTIGVKATKIDKDHVDDIGPAAAFVRIGEVKLADRCRNSVSQQVMISQSKGREATRYRHHCVTQTA